LAVEQRRGVLGPAYLRWRENSSVDNRRRWSGYDWSGRGEEWNASSEWKQALVDDVLVRWIRRAGWCLRSARVLGVPRTEVTVQSFDAL
jgi:hypothetical protein